MVVLVLPISILVISVSDPNCNVVPFKSNASSPSKNIADAYTFALALICPDAVTLSSCIPPLNTA